MRQAHLARRAVGCRCRTDYGLEPGTAGVPRFSEARPSGPPVVHRPV